MYISNIAQGLSSRPWPGTSWLPFFQLTCILLTMPAFAASRHFVCRAPVIRALFSSIIRPTPSRASSSRIYSPPIPTVKPGDTRTRSRGRCRLKVTQEVHQADFYNLRCRSITRQRSCRSPDVRSAPSFGEADLEA
ncbi:hypothetical protein BDY21DRAFT_331426 [Lineolata rhizophorae]|uniref:Uncharacterized protein n=1 Tax=Lineolata rhizophorae TaxID=578093 RepID=A0A6A6PEP2_9PEZI|nr:hypothetical protein BDY21DRAFT_331426 [Lineolata rhizophorae]